MGCDWSSTPKRGICVVALLVLAMLVQLAGADDAAAPATAPAVESAMAASQPAAPATAPATTTASVPATPPNLSADAAIARGLSFLSRQQNRDGSFDSGGGSASGGSGKCATTGLCLLAFLSAGHTPDVGRYGLTVRNAVDFLLRQSPKDGDFGAIDGSRMYGQAIVALALAEVYGVESEARRRQIQPVLASAVQRILGAQAGESEQASESGGWRNDPQQSAGQCELALSGWNALALRAAQNVGMNVPKAPVERAVAFVERCFVAQSGGFASKPGGEASAGMTGAGVLSLCLLDAADQPQVAPAARFLAANPVTPQAEFSYDQMFYVTLAANQVGGATWPAVWKVAQQRLPALQQTDGGWPASATPEGAGRPYATSMAVLTLAVPYRLLPIYQR